MNALDKEEFRIKLEEINRLVEKKNYKDAMEVVDSIDWRRVKNVRTLCVVGEIYAANKRYEDSKEIFLLAYHRAAIGKNILYRLIEVSLKMKDISEAEEFYEEFLHSAVDYAAIRTNWSFMTVAERLNQDHYRTVHHDAFIARLQAVCRICGITELEELMPDRKTKGDFASYITAFLGISQR